MYVNGQTVIKTRFSTRLKILDIEDIRTAIINYLFAHKFSGSFFLCINDIDNKNVSNNIKAANIINDLQWLDIKVDYGPIYQSNKIDRYRNAAEELIRMGRAYPDPSTNSTTPYRGINRHMDSNQALLLYKDTNCKIRFVMPNQKVVVDDLIQGNTEFHTNNYDDPIIITKKGFPSPWFADAIDDMDMEITHVIRPEIENHTSLIQILLYDALAKVPPYYASMPTFVDKNKQKITITSMYNSIPLTTKTNLRYLNFTEKEIMCRSEFSPALVSFYQATGFSSCSLSEYITDFITTKLDKIPRTNPVFDIDKLLGLNWGFLTKQEIDIKANKCLDFLQEAKLVNTPVSKEEFAKVKKVVELCGKKIEIYSDILTHAYFFFKKPVYSYFIYKDHLNSSAVLLLDSLKDFYDKLHKWESAFLLKQTREFLQNRRIEISKLINPLRIAIMGKPDIGPTLFKSMELLGKEECLSRIDKLITEHYLGLFWGGFLRF